MNASSSMFLIYVNLKISVNFAPHIFFQIPDMESNPFFNSTRQTIFILVILILGAIAMIPTTIHDLEWTKYLYDHASDDFKKFMADSIFEGESLGGGDLAFIYVVIVSLAYLLSWLPELKSDKTRKRWSGLIKLLDNNPGFKKRLVDWRHFMGYHVVVGLFNSVYLIHPLKWVLGRARPYLVFPGEKPFTEWFEIGPHFLTDGHYHGAFPSGHAATVFIFIALTYVLILNGRNSLIKGLGWLVGLFSFSISSLMLVARAMQGAHWVSDSMFIIFVGWAVAHSMYYFGIHMPKRSQYMRETGRQMPVPLFYELQICWYMFVLALGFTFFFFGIRALFRGEMLYMAVGIPLGGYAFYFGLKKAKKIGFFAWKRFVELSD